MKVKLPKDFIVCPNCGEILAESPALIVPEGNYFSRILCGKPITCPACNQKLTAKSKVLNELPDFPKIVEVACSNPECNSHYVSDEADRNSIFQCERCGQTLKFPARPKKLGNFAISSIVSEVTLHTPLVSLSGNLAVTRMGLFLFIQKLKPGSDRSRLGSDGNALFERIKTYVDSDSANLVKTPTAIQLQILHRQFGIWAILEKFVDYIRISPAEIANVFYNPSQPSLQEKAQKLLEYGILSTNYGSIAFTVDDNARSEIVEALKWFVDVSKHYRPEYDALFFDSPAKYFCECGSTFKAYASAIGLDAICYNCGRKFTFRHRPLHQFQKEINTGIPVPKEVTFVDGADSRKKLKFSICTSCSKWTWVEEDSDISTPVCRFCKTPVKIGKKASKWIEYACPYCSSKIVVPEILGGCEAVCKSCGDASIVPRISVY